MASTAERVEVLALGPLPVMLAAALEQLPSERRFDGRQAEPKHDGIRAKVIVGDGRCRVESRRGTDLTAAFPDIALAALAQLPEQTALDGELVVGVDSRLDFSELQRRLAAPARAALLAAAAPSSFLAFDLLVLRGGRTSAASRCDSDGKGSPP